MLRINGREVVTMLDSPDLSLCAAITDPCLGVGHWTDDTTPRTDRPVRFISWRIFAGQGNPTIVGHATYVTNRGHAACVNDLVPRR